jgi:hypothetical protein
MTQEDFIKRLTEEHLACVEISKKKNLDYSSPEDAFANFNVAKAYDIDPKIGILVRMSDKMKRASRLFTKGADVSESFTDTMRDLANYALILALYYGEERGE